MDCADRGFHTGANGGAARRYEAAGTTSTMIVRFPEKTMSKQRQLILLLFSALALAGLYSAVHNLPVLTGCSFYADCPGAGGELAAE